MSVSRAMRVTSLVMVALLLAGAATWSINAADEYADQLAVEANQLHHVGAINARGMADLFAPGR